MKQIICLSHTPWSSCPSRTQQLISRLTGVDVLFFEPPGPKPDNKGRKVRPNVVVYQLPKLIDIASRTPPVARWNRKKITRCVEKAMAHHRFREPLLWCTSPENIHQIDYLAYRGLVYDCQRYWSNLPVQWEGDLAAAADVCFVASEGLEDRLSTCSVNIALLPNGSNYPLFRREALELPADLNDLVGKPVFCFVGSLHADLDLSPLLLAADKHPEWTFLLIGPVYSSAHARKLEQWENIRILGKRAQVDLPDYLAHCSVCINLLRTSDEDSDVIPSRVYEYLAAGKPVVSMAWRHQREEFPDVVYSARNPQEFVRKCETALAENHGELSALRQERAGAFTWDSHAETLSRILDANGLR